MKGTVSAVSTALRSALRGLFPLWGRQPLIARRLRAISRSPANWIRCSRGAAPYGTISAKTFRPGCFKSFSTVRPTRLPAESAGFGCRRHCGDGYPPGGCLPASGRAGGNGCHAGLPAPRVFPFRRKALEGRGMGRHFPLRSALRDRGQREECDLRRAGPAHLSVVLRADGTLWCGLLYWCLRDVLPDFLPRLGIPDTHQLGYAMLFGYPSINYRRTVETRSALVRHIGWN